MLRRNSSFHRQRTSSACEGEMARCLLLYSCRHSTARSTHQSNELNDVWPVPDGAHHRSLLTIVATGPARGASRAAGAGDERVILHQKELRKPAFATLTHVDRRYNNQFQGPIAVVRCAGDDDSKLCVESGDQPLISTVNIFIEFGAAGTDRIDGPIQNRNR